MTKKKLLEYLLPYDDDAEVDFVIHRKKNTTDVLRTIIGCISITDDESGYSSVSLELKW